MDAQELRNLQKTYMEVVENKQLNEISDRKVAAVGRHRQSNVNKAMSSNEYISDKPGATQKLSINISKLNRFKNLEKKRSRRNKSVDESYDLYDIILSHLLDEGYASTQESADKIILNMSESWFEEIMKLNEARAEEKRGLGSTGRQRQRQKTGVVTSSGEVAHPATSYSGGQNPHLRGKDYVSKTQRREASRRYVDQPGGIYAKPENKQGEGRYAKMQAKKRDQSHMHSRYD